jgi:short-subunit dehydrogenase
MVVLITGASTGLGRLLALHYLDRGCKVAALARRKAKLDELRRTAQGRSGVLRIYPADVTDRDRMAHLVALIERELGPLDLVIANAGVGDQRLSAELDLNRFEQVIATNVMGVAYTLAPAIAAMRCRGSGQLVAISSLAGLQVLPRLSTYCASKAAVNYQLEGLYWDLKPHGIHVTTVCPGFIDTAMTAAHGVPERWLMNPDKAIAKITKAIARKRRRYCFPAWLYWVLRLLGAMPVFIQGLVFVYVFEWLFPRPRSAQGFPRAYGCERSQPER